MDDLPAGEDDAFAPIDDPEAADGFLALFDERPEASLAEHFAVVTNHPEVPTFFRDLEAIVGEVVEGEVDEPTVFLATRATVCRFIACLAEESGVESDPVWIRQDQLGVFFFMREHDMIEASVCVLDPQRVQ